MTRTVRALVRTLDLRPHPEGGFYRETWRTAGRIHHTALPRHYGGPRPYVTSILFMLPAGTVSRWHRVRSDELWCWQGGGGVELAEIRGGRVQVTRIGPGRGAVLQHVVPGRRWFAARPAPGARYGLVGCVVAPGFDFRDFELAEPEALVRRFPRSAASIIAYAGGRPGDPRAGRRR